MTPPPPAQFDVAAQHAGGATIPDAEGDGYVAALPLLVVGAAGPLVRMLAGKLAEQGYENAVAQGRSAPVLDDALMALVELYQEAEGIDPRRYDGQAPPLIPARGRHSGIVDAATWAALLGERIAWGSEEHAALELLALRAA